MNKRESTASIVCLRKGVTWPCVGYQSRQCRFRTCCTSTSTSTSSQTLLPPVTLDWVTALLVVATGMLEADHEKRAGDSGPYFWGGFGLSWFPVAFLALNELSPVCKALLVSVSPGFVGRICICAVSAVDGPIIATDAILNLASSYSMVARPGDVRALVNIATKNT